MIRNKVTIYLLSSALLVFCGSGLFAQQKPVFSQYMIEKYLVNPAFAGSNGYTSVNLTGRQQYSGFSNPPRTFMVSGQTRLLDDSWIMKSRPVRKKTKRASRIQNIGLGAYLFNDRNGIISRTGFQLTYAYHVQLNNNYQISFGLSGQGYQYKIDDRGADLFHPDDPLLLANKKSFFVPDFNVGTYFSGRGFYAGLSATELLGSWVKLGKNKFKDFKTLRHFYFVSGYKIGVTSNFIIEPSVLAQSTVKSFQLDAGMRFFYTRNYWIGFAYRTNKTLVSMLGIKVDGFFLGYAYDSNIGAIKNYSGGTHEIIFGMQLGANNTRRARWLRPDVSGMEE
jgi:type IX secretion system PorP/SprF family membrane protein